MFLVLKTVLLNFCKISKKLPITESNFSNVADETVLKSLFVIDTFLRIHREFRNNFLKEYVEQVTCASLKVLI